MKSSAMHRLCPSGDGDEVAAFDEAETRGELAHLGAALRARDSAERERSEEVGRALDADDRRPVDPLAELARVDLDEGGERGALGEELARERLSGRAPAPDDRGAAAGEQRPAQEVDLAAPENASSVYAGCVRVSRSGWSRQRWT